MSVKTAEELTARARRLKLAGTVHYSVTNGPGWRYQWCPDKGHTRGLGDRRSSARITLDAIAWYRDLEEKR